MKVTSLSIALLATVVATNPANAEFELKGLSTVTVPAGSVDYRSSGEYLEGGYPIDAPMQKITFEKPFEIMAFQVTVGQYERCVAANACRPRLGNGRHPSHVPVTGVSYRDATDFAAWLSKKTSSSWRLPTDREWSYAAGDRFIDDALSIDKDTDNPASRWLAKYKKYANKNTGFDPVVKTSGSYGTNEFGIYDMAGNIWEWTDTCYSRIRTTDSGEPLSTTKNCGVRIAAGQHRAYITSFIQDAKGGGCSVGAPPDYLGFRLVREKPKVLMGTLREKLGL